MTGRAVASRYKLAGWGAAMANFEITPTTDGFRLIVLTQHPGQQNFSTTIRTMCELEIAQKHLDGERHKTKDCPLCKIKP